MIKMINLFESERLYFREFIPEDAEKLFALNSDPEVIQYTGDPPFESVESAKDFILNYDHYQRHGFGRWAVVLKENNEFIGWCGLKYNEEEEIDIGFRFFKKYWGMGYATESAAATLHFGIKTLKLKRIVGRAAHENKASLKVLEKVGFSYLDRRTCHGIDMAHYYEFTVE
jgi:RimJ/RimL family protein N-acetyltransferase